MPGFITSSTLHCSERLVVDDVRCSCPRSVAGGAEISSANQIVLIRRGVFVRHFGRDEEVSDKNTITFFEQGKEHRVSHPIEGGDECICLTPSESTLRESLAEFIPNSSDGSQVSFPWSHGLCSTEAFLAQIELFRSVKSGTATEMEIEELSLHTLRVAIRSAIKSSGAGCNRLRRRSDTRKVHRDLAEGAKSHLSGVLGGRVDLAEVSAGLHVSPYHLSRVFRDETGMTMSEYVRSLRVREALRMLADGERDLTTISIHAGFYDHSHFTNVFRRYFRRSPSAFRDAHAQRRDD